jgi:flagellar basal-body rod protein FlgB
MSLFNIDLLGVAMQRLRHSATRQQVISENVANADTPNRLARDVTAFSFGQELERVRLADKGQVPQDPGALRVTQASHMATPTENGFRPSDPSESWEVLPGGNAIELEQQMLAMTQSKLQYDEAAAYYGKATDMLRAAMSVRF